MNVRRRIYGRVSTVDQTSTKLQIDEIKLKTGEVDKCIEEKKTAKDKDGVYDPIEYMKLRPKFYEECYLPATRGEYDELWVWKWDRFSRSNFQPILFDMFKDLGVTVIALKDSNEAIVRDIQGVLSKEEIRKIKERVEAKQQQLIKEGKVITRMPFGYKAIKRLIKGRMKVIRWDINEKEAEIVRQIFSLKKRQTVKQISTKVDMPYSTVKDILNNKVYFGIVKFRDIEYKSDQFKPILP